MYRSTEVSRESPFTNTSKKYNLYSSSKQTMKKKKLQGRKYKKRKAETEYRKNIFMQRDTITRRRSLILHTRGLVAKLFYLRY